MSYQMFDAVVSDIRALSPLIKLFTLKNTQGAPLPAYTGGSHIIVQMGGFSNAYSLTGSPQNANEYQIAVRRNDEGKGGSVYLHDAIKVGDAVRISEPNNLFELDMNAKRHVLIAGGIGITPFIPHLRELQAAGAEHELHYAFRSPEHGAFWPWLQESAHQPNCHAYIDSEGGALDLAQLVLRQPEGAHVYVCGPQPMIDAVIAACKKAAYSDERIHWEQFTSLAPENTSGFEVVLAKTGASVNVAADETILQAIEKAGVSVECLCREGVCGTCETAILEGEAEHFDQYLEDDEKAAQKTMMICVSRAKGARLVLDL